MTGIGCMMAAGAASGGGGTAPLTCVVTFTGGAGPFNVAGASGDLASQFSGAAIGASASGGTFPYTIVTSIEGDASGKISKTPVAGDPFNHDTAAWSGFAINEIEFFYVECTVTDSVGATATARYPANPATVISIKRTS